jgi:hypothetical protein
MDSIMRLDSEAYRLQKEQMKKAGFSERKKALKQALKEQWQTDIKLVVETACSCCFLAFMIPSMEI